MKFICVLSSFLLLLLMLVLLLLLPHRFLTLSHPKAIDAMNTVANVSPRLAHFLFTMLFSIALHFL